MSNTVDDSESQVQGVCKMDETFQPSLDWLWCCQCYTPHVFDSGLQTELDFVFEILRLYSLEKPRKSNG